MYHNVHKENFNLMSLLFLVISKFGVRRYYFEPTLRILDGHVSIKDPNTNAGTHNVIIILGEGSSPEQQKIVVGEFHEGARFDQKSSPSIPVSFSLSPVLQ